MHFVGDNNKTIVKVRWGKLDLSAFYAVTGVLLSNLSLLQANSSRKGQLSCE